MNEEQTRKPFGLLLAGATGIAASGLIILSTPFVLPALRRVCLPYVPATDAQIHNVFRMLSRRKGSVIDLGSGDGRIVIEAAKNGFIASGVELNPWLVLFSRSKALLSGVGHSTDFKCKDLWKVDLSKYNNVIIFGVEEMMPQLEQKFLTELNDGSWIIACRYPLPNWKPTAYAAGGIDSVWQYEKGISNKCLRNTIII